MGVSADSQRVNAAEIAKWRGNNPVPELEPWLTGKGMQVAPIASVATLAVGVLLARPRLPAVVVLVVIIVGVPIMLGLADRVESGPITPTLSVLRLLSPVAGIFALFSMMAGSGFFSGILSLIWLSFAAGVAGFGALRLLSRPVGQRHAVGVDFSLMLIGVGALMFTLAQFTGSATLLHSTAIVYVAGAVGSLLIALAPPMLPENCRLADLVASGTLVAAGLALLHPRLGAIGSALLIGVAVSISRRLLTGADTVGGSAGFLLRVGSWSLILAFVIAPFSEIVRAVDFLRFDLSFLTADALTVGSWSIGYQRLDSAVALIIATLSGASVVASLVGLARTTPSVYAQASAFTFHAGPRTDAEMAQLLNHCASQPDSEPMSLASEDLPTGYQRSTWSLPVADFDNSCDSVLGWAGHEAAGVTLYPPRPQISSGETFTLAVPLGPVTVTAASRITDIVDEEDSYGFASTTLGHHLWEGGESIIVTRAADGTSRVTGTVVWRPTRLGVALSRRLTERLMGRVVTACAEGIAAAETALVGDYLSTIVEDVSSRKMEVSRDALVQRTVTPLIAAPSELPQEESPRWDSGWEPVGVQAETFEVETPGPGDDLAPPSATASAPATPSDQNGEREPFAASAIQFDAAELVTDRAPDEAAPATGAPSDQNGEPEASVSSPVLFNPADLFADLVPDEVAPAETAPAESDRLSFDDVFSQPFEAPDLERK